MTKNCLLFRLLLGYSIKEAKQELTALHISDQYIIKDISGEVLIGGMGHQIDTKSLITCQYVDQPQCISWTDQWSRFAKNFHNGLAHIHLDPYSCRQTLLLLPGPGFGDLSHPSTHLMLEMMREKMNHQVIVDMGCGSGILALSALLMGAKKSYGIDIDLDALVHAQKNAILNHLEKKVRFSESVPKICGQNVILINMILSEQKVAIRANPRLLQSKHWMISGILESQKKEALAFFNELGLHTIEERKRGDWLGFVTM